MRYAPGIYTIRNKNSDADRTLIMSDNIAIYSMGQTIMTINVSDNLYFPTTPTNVTVTKIGQGYFSVVGNNTEIN